MNNIEISFKELIDYIRDKDLEIDRLNCRLKEANYELSKLKDEHYAICNYLREKRIDLVIERNKIHEIEKEPIN